MAYEHVIKRLLADKNLVGVGVGDEVGFWGWNGDRVGFGGWVASWSLHPVPAPNYSNHSNKCDLFFYAKMTGFKSVLCE